MPFDDFITHPERYAIMQEVMDAVGRLRAGPPPGFPLPALDNPAVLRAIAATGAGDLRCGRAGAIYAAACLIRVAELEARSDD